MHSNVALNQIALYPFTPKGWHRAKRTTTKSLKRNLETFLLSL